MVNFETNQEPEKENRFASMSDEEFYGWCENRYGHAEKQNFLPYKTIVFKKGDKGLYSNDLNKIALIDDHEPVEGVEVGVAYIVEIVRDTNSSEQRKGALVVKIIKPAEFEDVVKNREVTDELSQLDFHTSKRNPNECVNNSFSKVTLVERGCRVESNETYVGRIEDMGTVNIFKPLLKACLWQKYGVETGNSEGRPLVRKSTYFGINKTGSELVFTNEDNVADVVAKLSAGDREVIIEELKRKQKREEVNEQRQQQFNEAIERATNQAWSEYMLNRVQVEEIGEKTNTYKVKIDDNWSDVSGSEQQKIVDNSNNDDWRLLIASQAVKIIKDDNFFVKQLKNNEKKDFDTEKILSLVPEKKLLGETSGSKEEIGGVINNFRQEECKKIIVNLPYIEGELVFEPILLRYDDVHDSDFGHHRDDSTGQSSFQMVYKLQAEKITFTEAVRDLPEHISARIKQLINGRIDSLRHPASTFLQYEVAEWVADYKNKIDSLRKLTLKERIEGTKAPKSERVELLKEKLALTSKEFSDLQKDLPIEEYIRSNGDGSYEYFGLPVKRGQLFKTKQYTRTNMTTEIPVPGEYSYKFFDYGDEQLSFWLDSHKEYFEKMKEKRESSKNEVDLPRLDVSIAEETAKRCNEMGLKPDSRGHNGNYFFELSYGCVLNLNVNLSDDFSKLVIDVCNLNYGFNQVVENAATIYETVVAKKWNVNDQVKKILLASGIEVNKIEKLPVKKEKQILAKDVELPFKGL